MSKRVCRNKYTKGWQLDYTQHNFKMKMNYGQKCKETDSKLALQIYWMYIFSPATLSLFHAMSRSLRSSALFPIFICTLCPKMGGRETPVTLPRPLLKNAVGADDLC